MRPCAILGLVAAIAFPACSGHGASSPTDQADGAPRVGMEGGLWEAGEGDADIDADSGASAVHVDGDSGTSAASEAGAVGADSGFPQQSRSCRPTCATHRWACWPMPNPPATGLPNPASYTDNGDGTIIDNVTCLTWQKVASTSMYTVAQGRAYCATLGIGWRMATRIEMMSIDDLTQIGAKVDPAAFPGTPTDFFKTGSEWALATKQIGSGRGTDFGWVVNFSDGTTVNNLVSASTPSFVRCVRGGGDADLDTAPGALAVAPPNQYAVGSPGEVTDSYTGLIWQRAYSAVAVAWVDASTYCSALGLNGHAWRTPSIRELSTLVDESQVAPAIQRAMFPGTKWGANNWYWASDRAVGSMAAWAINYDDGFTAFNAGAAGALNSFAAAWVRCVR